MTTALMISESIALAARFSWERVTGIEPALSARVNGPASFDLTKQPWATYVPPKLLIRMTRGGSPSSLTDAADWK